MRPKDGRCIAKSITGRLRYLHPALTRMKLRQQRVCPHCKSVIYIKDLQKIPFAGVLRRGEIYRPAKWACPQCHGLVTRIPNPLGIALTNLLFTTYLLITIFTSDYLKIKLPYLATIILLIIILALDIFFLYASNISGRISPTVPYPDQDPSHPISIFSTIWRIILSALFIIIIPFILFFTILIYVTR